MLFRVIAAAVLLAGLARAADVDPETKLDPLVAVPPSTNFEVGLWHNAPEYGAWRYRKGDKPDPLSEAPRANPGSAKASKLRNGRVSTLFHVGSEFSSQIDRPLRNGKMSSLSEPGMKQMLPPGAGIPASQSETPRFIVGQAPRKTPENALRRGWGDPETMPPGALVPSREPQMDLPSDDHLAGRRPSGDWVRGKLGEAETMPAMPAAPQRDVAMAYAAGDGQFGQRAAPMGSVRRHSMPGGDRLMALPAIPYHEQGKIDAGDGEVDWVDLRHSAIPDLIELLEKGGSARLRARAADELGRRGPEAAAAVPALSRAVADGHPRIRASAALALGNIGGDSKKLRQLLTPLLKERNPDVRTSVQTALSRLE